MCQGLSELGYGFITPNPFLNHYASTCPGANPMNNIWGMGGFNPYMMGGMDMFSMGGGYGNGFTYMSSRQGYDAQVMNGIKRLHYSVQKDDQDKFLHHYKSLERVVMNELKISGKIRHERGESADAYNERLRLTAKANIDAAYTQYTGQDLASSLEAYGDSAFSQGIKDVFGLKLLTDSRTVADNVAYINGDPYVDKRKNVQQIAGRMFGGALAGAAIGSIAPGLGTVIGAGIGAISGLLLSSWK